MSNIPTLTTSVADKLKAAKDRAAVATGAVTRVRPQAYKLTDADTTVKVGIFGPLGSGKSTFLVGPLLCGERILVKSTDFGGNGLLSVVNELKRIGRADLIENIRNVDIADYKDAIDMMESPQLFVPDLEAFDPTVYFWDGYSTFNIDLLDEYSETAKEMEGLKDDKWAHWYDVKRATLRSMRKFFGFRLPNGKRLHKIMSFVEAKPDTNDLTNVTEKAPLIQGGAKDLSTGGFDVVFNCYSEEKDGKFTYYYRCRSAKHAVKNRGFDLKPVEVAEPERIWRILTGGTK